MTERPCIDCPATRLVGAGEIAAWAGLSRQRIQQLRVEGDFPKPVAILMMGRVWRECDVQAWFERRRHLGGVFGRRPVRSDPSEDFILVPDDA
ncbi:hypothetical protein GCM10010437_024910 [Actinoplanes palleronii]